MKIYSQKYNCCGCRLCEKICPTQSITMLEDEKGFIYPTINETTCVNCGKCGDFCVERQRLLQMNRFPRGHLIDGFAHLKPNGL